MYAIVTRPFSMILLLFLIIRQPENIYYGTVMSVVR